MAKDHFPSGDKLIASYFLDVKNKSSRRYFGLSLFSKKSLKSKKKIGENFFVGYAR